ncbi:MAG: hypothetical protein UV78_C0050G0011 [Parcubacteria group bacterium GW2011_GWA2_43_17]|nr:MAG: hypothetical protein UV78_C0050G0011 [Parcubacteria group bacterium GW2011_GWA2_43_17]KKT90723.1 MAG: hypothetical protein UW91_C0049G0003 [Parcubacteria group bacterium GW2011_GWF2_45_11]
MNKESSDEKLLKLIEGQAKNSGGPKPVLSLKFKPKAAKFSLKDIPFKLKLNFNLPFLNKSLFVVCVLLTLIFVYILIFGSRSNLNAELFFLTPGANVSLKPQAGQKEEFKPSLQEYLDTAKKRNVYLPRGKIISNPQAAQETVRLADLVKDLKLVGVIWSTNPEAMVEDMVNKRTHLLKKGDTFGANQYKVKDITRSSVILEITVEGAVKEWELR